MKHRYSSTLYKFLALAVCLSMLLPALGGLISYAVTSGTMDHTADGSTMDDYTAALDLAANSRYAGRVWADKSVFTGDITLNGKTITNDSDFLHVFSALGSSQVVNTTENVPLDVVFILDVSGSMTSIPAGQKDRMRIKLVMNAVNNAIDTINSLGQYNRVSIVLYANEAAVYLPLVNLVGYNQVHNHIQYPANQYGCAKGTWFCEEDATSYSYTYYMNCNQMRKADANLEAGADGDNEAGWTAVKTPGELGITYLRFGWGTGEMRDYGGYRLGDATNMQAGIAAGMNVLATEEVTTWISPETGQTYNRIPVVMVMTDGGCNTLCTSNDGNNSNSWYNTKFYDNPKAKDSNVRLNDNPVDNNTEYITSSAVPTLLTAAYNMARIKKNYAARPHAFGVAVDTTAQVEGDSNEKIEREIQRLKIQATLNPSDESLKAAYNYLSSNAKSVYDYIEEWKNDTTGTRYVGQLPNKNSSNTSVYVSQLPDGSEITKQDVINNLYFTEGFYDTDGDKVNEVFSSIVTSISYDTTVFTPVGGSNDLNVKDALTYMDPIGKYMEVKSVKNVLLFGKLYTVAKDGEEKYFDANDKETSADNCKYSIQYYKITDTGEISNPCYGVDAGVTFNLSEIEIYVKTTGDYEDPDIAGNDGIQSDADHDQALYINIPVAALPMQVVTVMLGANGSVLSYDTNLADTTQSTPIRVVYTVGLSEEVLTEDEDGVKVDITKIAPDYRNANSVGNKLYFYSNWYNKENKYSDYVTGRQDEYTFGDPVVTFSPDKDNRYYIFRKAHPLYYAGDSEDSMPAGGVITGSGTSWTLNGTSLGDPVVTTISSDSWYYMVIEYYSPEGVVYQAVTRKGSEFGSAIGGTEGGASAGAYLCWYDPDTGECVDYMGTNGPVAKPGDRYVIAARPDGVRVGDMAQSIGTKANGTNLTNTSHTYYLPTVSSSTAGSGSEDTIINVYLGNNGRLAVIIPLTELPETGGPGVWLYWLSGGTLLTYAAAYVLPSGKKKRKARE